MASSDQQDKPTSKENPNTETELRDSISNSSKSTKETMSSGKVRIKTPPLNPYYPTPDRVVGLIDDYPGGMSSPSESSSTLRQEIRRQKLKAQSHIDCAIKDEIRAYRLKKWLDSSLEHFPPTNRPSRSHN